MPIDIIRRLFGTEPERPDGRLTVYREAVRDRLVNRRLSNIEREDLASFRDELGLTQAQAEQVYREEAGPFLQNLITAALEDGMFSPAEEADFKAMAKDLGLNPELDDVGQAALDAARRRWRLAHDPLPDVPVSLGLVRNEVAHAEVQAEAWEERSRTKAVSYAGPTISIPIIKGVRYRVGRMNVARETQQFMHSFGTGQLVVSDRRLMFVGPNKSITTRLTAILDLETFTDGTRVVKTTGKPVLYMHPSDENFGLILTRAWAAARD